MITIFITCSVTEELSNFVLHVLVLAAFRSKWKSTQARKEYTETFSLSKWQAMDKKEQKCHSVSNCVACVVQHSDLQAAIPLKPVFMGENEENTYGPVKKVTERAFAQTHFSKFNSLLPLVNHSLKWPLTT